MEISSSGMGQEQSKLCPASYVLLLRGDTDYFCSCVIAWSKSRGHTVTSGGLGSIVLPCALFLAGIEVEY